MDLEEIGINAGNWVDSAQDRDYWRALVNAAFDLRVPLAMELVNSTGKRPLEGLAEDGMRILEWAFKNGVNSTN